jgi:hypothetical protein
MRVWLPLSLSSSGAIACNMMSGRWILIFLMHENTS